MPPQSLTVRQINRATLARQGLLQPLAPGAVAAMVASIGALQAQHPAWPAFALGARSTAAAPLPDVMAGRASRALVRASLMRMTVHLVDARDFWPMSLLTIGYRRDQFRALYKVDPLSSPLGRALSAAVPSVVAAMAERPLAISEIDAIVRAEVGSIEIPPHRAIWRHIAGSIPLVLAPVDDEAYGRGRYLPAATWIGDAPPLEEAEAAALLAERYLAAFGPASVEDFVAFMGRGRHRGLLKTGIEALGQRLVHFRDEHGRELLDLADAPRPAGDEPAPPRLLARWDSLLLAYGTRYRSRILPPERQATVITRNADVLPTFTIDGFVAGTWLPRRSEGGERYAELRPFGPLAAADRRALEQEAARTLPALADGAYARYPGTD